MAKGKNCPQCKRPMFASKEKEYPAGTEVIYQCTNQNFKNSGRPCDFKERVFEDK